MGDKQKIPINTTTTGWSNPFSRLPTEGLSSGEASPGKSRQPPPMRLERVVLRRETAHRGGKTVIVVHDFPPQVSNAQIEQ